MKPNQLLGRRYGALLEIAKLFNGLRPSDLTMLEN